MHCSRSNFVNPCEKGETEMKEGKEKGNRTMDVLAGIFSFIGHSGMRSLFFR